MGQAPAFETGGELKRCKNLREPRHRPFDFLGVNDRGPGHCSPSQSVLDRSMAHCQPPSLLRHAYQDDTGSQQILGSRHSRGDIRCTPLHLLGFAVVGIWESVDVHPHFLQRESRFVRDPQDDSIQHAAQQRYHRDQRKGRMDRSGDESRLDTLL